MVFPKEDALAVHDDKAAADEVRMVVDLVASVDLVTGVRDLSAFPAGIWRRLRLRHNILDIEVSATTLAYSRHDPAIVKRSKVHSWARPFTNGPRIADT